VTNFILRIKEDETRLTLHEHYDDDNDYGDDDVLLVHPITCHEGPEGRRGIALLFLQPWH